MTTTPTPSFPIKPSAVVTDFDLRAAHPVSKLITTLVLRHISKLTTDATVATATASKCLHRNTNSCRRIGRRSTCSRPKPVTFQGVYSREVGLQPTRERTGETICLVLHLSCKNGVRHHWRITQ
ncbi:Hypothetical protein CINCED_3A005846 [Cinara cedri]|uniref:Uncharacterized protein n=1 Tax=Cinara cedri TaxID=506608 RepID=A0A5E4MIB2_9HEMI|nr:Hypothetical protein CINCED_3A005846 [Cinara cedri]